MKDIKAIFFDVDGTLLDPKLHILPESTLNALHRLKSKGYKLAVATGRNLESCKEANIVDAFEWDGFVCVNGQQVYDQHQNELYHFIMDEEMVIKIIEVAEEENINLLFEGKENFLNHPVNDLVIEAHNFFKEAIPDLVKPYEFEPIDMILGYAPMDYDWAKFRAIDGVLVYPGESTYADILALGNSKYEGIKMLLSHWGIKHAPYAAFGDSLNDMEMMEHAALGIAMGNGNDQLKRIADVITRPVDQDGIDFACTYTKLG